MKDRPAPRYDGFTPSSKTASEVKRATRSKNTAPELKLRRALWARGYRYRLHAAGLVGRPDILFPSQKVAVFCDGDFFHGKDWPVLKQKLSRRANPSYWIEKISYNRARDRDVTAELEAEGWTVLRFWESDINADAEAVAIRIGQVLREGSKTR